MRRVGVIPARWGSSRLPGKPLANLGGKPMVVRTLEQVKRVSNLDRVIVATDHDAVYEAVRETGNECVMTSSSLPSGTDRVLAACTSIGLQASDIVVNIQGDEPFISPRHIETLIDAMTTSCSDSKMATIACEETDVEQLHDSNVVKVVCDQNGDALYFSRFSIPFRRDQSVEVSFLRHIGLYAFRFDFLKQFATLSPGRLERAESLEQLRAMEAGYKVRVITVSEKALPGIDTPEQLIQAQQLFV